MLSPSVLAPAAENSFEHVRVLVNVLPPSSGAV